MKMSSFSSPLPRHSHCLCRTAIAKSLMLHACQRHGPSCFSIYIPLPRYAAALDRCCSQVLHFMLPLLLRFQSHKKAAARRQSFLFFTGCRRHGWLAFFSLMLPCLSFSLSGCHCYTAGGKCLLLPPCHASHYLQDKPSRKLAFACHKPEACRAQCASTDAAAFSASLPPLSCCRFSPLRFHVYRHDTLPAASRQPTPSPFSPPPHALPLSQVIMRRRRAAARHCHRLFTR